MTKISLGKKCPLCGKAHLVKPLDTLSERERRKLVKLDHRIFDKGYIGSLTVDDEVWEFYSPLVTEEVRIEISTPELTEDLETESKRELEEQNKEAWEQIYTYEDMDSEEDP